MFDKAKTAMEEEKTPKNSKGFLSYNSPVILTFTFIAVIIQAICSIPGTDFFHSLFITDPYGSFLNPLTYIRLFSHALGHGGWEHLIGNFTFILLVGPMLEEKYGAKRLLFMMFFTAGITAVINYFFFKDYVCGASGIVFMFILLASCTNTSEKEIKIPLTLILAAVFYLGQEIINSMSPDNISQLAHIVGGLCGAGFGLGFNKKSTPKADNADKVNKPMI